MNFSALISNIPLFSGISPETFSSFSMPNDYRIKEVLAGMVPDEDFQKCLGILLTGRASIFSSDHGRPALLRTLMPGDVFGAASLFCEESQPFSLLEAETQSRFCLIPRHTIYRLLDNPTFRDSYLAFLSGRVLFLNRKIQCFTAGSAERRLALWIAGEEHGTVLLPRSLSALADMLDIGRASLYRAFDKLESEGLIRKDGREITILDRDAIYQNYQ